MKPTTREWVKKAENDFTVATQSHGSKSSFASLNRRVERRFRSSVYLSLPSASSVVSIAGLG